MTPPLPASLRRCTPRWAMSSRDHLFKVLVVGDAAVGKTSLVQRYSQDSFSKHYKSTVGGETSRGVGGLTAGGRAALGSLAGSGSRRLASWPSGGLGVVGALPCTPVSQYPARFPPALSPLPALQGEQTC